MCDSLKDYISMLTSNCLDVNELIGNIQNEQKYLFEFY